MEVHMNRLGRIASLPVTLCLFFLPTTASAQHDLSVSGNVYYGDDSHPAAHVTVELRDSGGSNLSPEATSDSGRFEFRGLLRGTYELFVDVQGYDPVHAQFDVSFTSDRGMAIYLRPISGNRQITKGPSVSAHELSMPQKARDWMNSGSKKLRVDKDAAGSLTDFQQAVGLAPGYYEAHCQIGWAYLALGKRADAEKSFQKSIEVSADKYGEADIGLGTMMLDRGDFSVAEKTIRRGIELSPQFWLGPYELGRALLDDHRLADAQKSAEQAQALAPLTPIVYRLLSIIHLQQKDYAALIQDLDAYIKLDPDSPAGIRAKQLRAEAQEKISSAKMVPAS
jgi:Carboxypeptidase regulatory-like domain/Tetratricopeptide repeat